VPSPAGATPPLPPQGLYEGCAPGGELDTCIAHLARIRAAGFRCVLNYSAWYGTPAELLRYADAAQALGLQLIWPLNNPVWRELGDFGANYPSLATNPGGAIALVAGLPATWGFYIGDELPDREAPRVRRLSATVRAVAPGRPLLYVARPGARRLEPFAPYVDFAGADTYPVGSGDPSVRLAARSARAAASAAGARTAMVLQAFSWSQYTQNAFPPHYPGTATLRAMRDAAIENAHPSLILWYSYQDILRSDDPARRWRDLVRAAFAPMRN
jgi:hypothetical protein